MWTDGRIDRQRERDRQTDRERETGRQTDRQAFMTELIVAFRSFANGHKH